VEAGAKADEPSDDAIRLVVYAFDRMGEYPLGYVWIGGDFESGYELADAGGKRVRLQVMRRGSTAGDYRARFTAESTGANSVYPLSSALPFGLCMDFSGTAPVSFTYRCSKSGEFQGVFPDAPARKRPFPNMPGYCGKTTLHNANGRYVVELDVVVLPRRVSCRVARGVVLYAWSHNVESGPAGVSSSSPPSWSCRGDGGLDTPGRAPERVDGFEAFACVRSVDGAQVGVFNPG
jgi:hypothetical protein